MQAAGAAKARVVTHYSAMTRELRCRSLLEQLRSIVASCPTLALLACALPAWR
jgi:hypothetical protein